MTDPIERLIERIGRSSTITANLNLQEPQGLQTAEAEGYDHSRHIAEQIVISWD